MSRIAGLAVTTSFGASSRIVKANPHGLIKPTKSAKVVLVILDLHEGEASPIRRQGWLATVSAVATTNVLRSATAAANINVRPFDGTCQALFGFGLHVNDSVAVGAILTTDPVDNIAFCFVLAS
jgi:hypothetical protein